MIDIMISIYYDRYYKNITLKNIVLYFLNHIIILPIGKISFFYLFKTDKIQGLTIMTPITTFQIRNPTPLPLII